MSTNYSFYAVPAYFVLAAIPALYATGFMTVANNGVYDNANPRGAEFAASLAKQVPKRSVRRWERARAAHNNMLENAAFVVGAVLAGNMARLDADYLNTMMAAYLASRVLYIGAYIGIERQAASRLRTLIWISGVGLLGAIFVKAAGVVASSGLPPL